MEIRAKELAGVYEIMPELVEDERGYFARFFDYELFQEYGLATQYQQESFSYNRTVGTLRGLHYQVPPHGEIKLVSCISGSVFDVAVDIRPDSPTFGKYCSSILSAAKRNCLYIPTGFLHGFQTLEPDSTIMYKMSASYHKDAGRTINYQSPEFGIAWPLEVSVISEKDKAAKTWGESV